MTDDSKKEILPIIQEILPELLALKKEKGLKAILKLAQKTADNTNSLPEVIQNSTCKKGCHYCCHDEIFTTKTETNNIKAFIKKNKIKYNKNTMRHQAAKGYENLSWKEKKCAFLSPQGTCNIYTERPLICRNHMSMDNPEKCNKEHNPKTIFSDIKGKEAYAAMLALTLIELKGNQKPKNLAQLMISK